MHCLQFVALTLFVALPLVAQKNNPALADVLTQHNDSDRTGHNARETSLTPDAVKKSFGKLFDAEVDAQVYAQPLVVTGLHINGVSHNALIVGTAANTIYYFDADSGSLIWSKNYGPAAQTPSEFWPSDGSRWTPYRDMTPQIGIVSTPVVDRATSTLYFTTYTETPPQRANLPPILKQWVHAIDLMTHAEKFGSPVEVAGEIRAPATPATTMSMAAPRPGEKRTFHARGGANPFVRFHARVQMQRPGLLLVNGRLVMGFASHGDFGDFHGWIFSYDAADLRRPPAVWSSTPDLENPQRGEPVRGGIWQSGMGLTTDDAGYVYLMTGNGDFDQKENFGDTVIKLKVSGDIIERVDTFTPCDQSYLSEYDLDLGSSGVLHPPGSKYIIGGGKQGALYVLDTSDLGGFNPSNGGVANCATQDCTNRIHQQVQVSCPEVTGDTGHIHGSPVYWKSDARGPVIYVWCENDHLRALTWDDAKSLLSPTTCETSSWPAWALSKEISPATLNAGMTGGMLSISSNGGKDGIVWATTPYNNDANQFISPGILYAFDANDLSSTLWTSYQYLARDDFGNFAKFTPPTIANGKVYVPTFSRRVSVYGLNPPPPPPVVKNLLSNGSFEDKDPSRGWTLTPGATVTTAGYPLNGYPYYGSNSAELIAAAAPQSISQTVTAPNTGNYELSAYCLTSFLEQYVDPGSAGGILSVSVAGGAPHQQLVQSYTGYLFYTIQFSAKAGDAIVVSYSAPQWPADYPPQYAGNTWSYIDDVVLKSVP